MVVLAFLLTALLVSPQVGGELRISGRDAVDATVGPSGPTAVFDAETCCIPRDGVPETPCRPGDGCCAVCASCAKRLEGNASVPEPAQRPAAVGGGRPEPHVGGQHTDLVWHPPKR